MKIYLALFTAMVMTTTSKPVKIEFDAASEHLDWYIVNDGVMGGLSRGAVAYEDDKMIFKGMISLENNGGFSWVRSPFKNWQLEQYEGIRIRFKSDSGRKFGFTLGTPSPWYMPSYRYFFSGKKGEWTTVEMPLVAFKETRMGELTGKNISKNAIKDIQRLGIILYDKQAGNFHLEVDYMELY